MSIGFGPFELVLMVIGIGVMLLWLWSLLECLTRESSAGNTKIAWLLVLLLAPPIGVLLYLLVRRPQRVRELGA